MLKCFNSCRVVKLILKRKLGEVKKGRIRSLVAVIRSKDPTESAIKCSN